jgi:hypothetical protein
MTGVAADYGAIISPKASDNLAPCLAAILEASGTRTLPMFSSVVIRTWLTDPLAPPRPS